MSAGWIYLRKDASAYYIGKTSNPNSRDSAYRKENAAVATIDIYHVDDMDGVENELMDALSEYQFFPDNERRNETFVLDSSVVDIFYMVKDSQQRKTLEDFPCSGSGFMVLVDTRRYFMIGIATSENRGKTIDTKSLGPDESVVGFKTVPNSLSLFRILDSLRAYQVEKNGRHYFGVLERVPEVVKAFEELEGEGTTILENLVEWLPFTAFKVAS